MLDIEPLYSLSIDIDLRVPGHLNLQETVTILCAAVVLPIAVTTVINLLRSDRWRRKFVYLFVCYIRSSIHPIISDTLVTGLVIPGA